MYLYMGTTERRVLVLSKCHPVVEWSDSNSRREPTGRLSSAVQFTSSSVTCDSVHAAPVIEQRASPSVTVAVIRRSHGGSRTLKAGDE